MVISRPMMAPGGWGRMRPEQRQREIAARIGQARQLTVETLAAQFHVSAETIRRDLAQLAASGAVEKVHGGARVPRLYVEASFEDRMAEDSAAKLTIARKLGAIVEPGETLFIDTGSTTLACAGVLRTIARLTVITNSVHVARVMGGQAQVILLGGRYAPGNAQTVGPETTRQIADFRADRAILTCAGLDAGTGLMDADLDEAAVARAMCACARQVVAVAPAAKLGRVAAHRVCGLSDIACLVTDVPPSAGFTQHLEAAGVSLH